MDLVNVKKNMWNSQMCDAFYAPVHRDFIAPGYVRWPKKKLFMICWCNGKTFQMLSSKFAYLADYFKSFFCSWLGSTESTRYDLDIHLTCHFFIHQRWCQIHFWNPYKTQWHLSFPRTHTHLFGKSNLPMRKIASWTFHTKWKHF